VEAYGEAWTVIRVGDESGIARLEPVTGGALNKCAPPRAGDAPTLDVPIGEIEIIESVKRGDDSSRSLFDTDEGERELVTDGGVDEEPPWMGYENRIEEGETVVIPSDDPAIAPSTTTVERAGGLSCSASRRVRLADGPSKNHQVVKLLEAARCNSCGVLIAGTYTRKCHPRCGGEADVE
jgi:hypothetical protein